MIFKPLKRVLALEALLFAFGAEAKNYDSTPVFSQDFEDGATYTNEIWTGAVASERLGSSSEAPVALPNGYTVYNGSYSIQEKDDKKISQETRTRYDTKANSQYFRLVRYGNNTANFLFLLPSAATSLTDYKLEFDYHLDTSFGNAASKSGPSYTGTNGLAICMSSGAILATFTAPPVGKSESDSGRIFKGDTTEQIGNAFKVSSRGTYDSSTGLWLHVVVRGNAEEGVVMSVVNEKGTTILSETQLSATFDTVDRLYMKAGAYSYRHCISLDDVVVSKAMESQTFTWSGAAGDCKWSTPGNWTVGGVTQTEGCPGAKDTAIIAGSGLSITAEVGLAVSNLNFAAGSRLLFDVNGVELNRQVALLTVQENSGTALSSANILLTGYSSDAYVAQIDSSTLAVTVGLYDKTKFVWTGKGGNTLFATVGNWVYGATNGPAATTAPAGDSTVTFPETFTDGVTVTFGANTADAGIYFVLNCDVTFASDGTTTRTVYPWTITGTGTLSLANDISLQTVTGKGMTLGVDVNVLPSDGDDPWADYARFYLRGEKSTVTFNGAIKGSGYLRLEGDGNPTKYYYVNGDTDGFSGKIFTQYAWNSKKSDEATTLRLSSAAALSLGAATLEVVGRVWVLATNDTKTLSVGALLGTGVINNYNTATALTLEVGALNAEASASVTLTNNYDVGAWTVKKVGTGTQALTDATVAYNADLRAGWLGAPAGKAFGAVALNGGSFKFAVPYDEPWTNGTAQTLFTCTSGVEAGRTVDYVTLDLSAFEEIYEAAYDNSVANILKLTLTPSTATVVWNGPSGGYWSEAENWVIKGTTEHPSVAPGAGTAVEIGANACIAVKPGQTFSSVKADSTVRLGVLFTDTALSFTAPENFKGTLEAAGPFSVTGSGGVYTATRIPSTFTWVGGDGDWADVTNWKVGTYPTAVFPEKDDVAIFPTPLDAVTVTITTADRYASNVVANADLTLSGAKYLRTNLIYGDGLLTLNGAKVMCYNANMDISNDVCVATGTDNELRTSVDKNSTFDRINLLGKLSGDGNLLANHGNKQGAGVAFYGDNHAFSGTFETTYYNQRDATYMDSAIASSSNAVWKVNALSNSSTKNIFPSTDDDYKYFGAYVGSMWLGNGTKVEIGHRDDVESTLYAYAHVNYNGYTVRKVGSNALNLKYATSGTAYTKVDALSLEAGTVRLDYDLVPKAITFEQGGTLAFTGDLGDLAGKIVGSTATIVIDDGGSDATWTAAIPASNVGGFTKKGAGTLTLESIPRYSGITKVEAGKLIVPYGTQVTLDAATVANGFEGGEITNVIFTSAVTTTTVTTNPSEIGIKYFAGPINFSNVTVDLQEKTDWTKGSVYYVVIDGAVLAGTDARKSTCHLELPAKQRGKWGLRAVNLPGYEDRKSLAVVPQQGLVVFVQHSSGK